MNTNEHEYGEEQIITDHAQSFVLALLLVLDFSCFQQRDDHGEENDLATATMSWNLRFLPAIRVYSCPFVVKSRSLSP